MAEATGGGRLSRTLPGACAAAWQWADANSSRQVNHSPSFTTDSLLDQEVKDALLCDTLVLINLRGCDKRKVLEEDKRRVKGRLLQCQQELREAR